MSLSAGTKLAHYEILEPIGKGGMGEVYRAKDSKLGRDVAIKVLPEEFARDKERLDRFEREAWLLAQLNHSNIATLHGLDEHDGQPFLVMELVEGETLAERIAKGTVPVDEAIPMFIQIADGLEAAHEKGIIHRDLKPANIKISPDGKPKILDFGLAKAFLGEHDSGADLSRSPTLTKGTTLGAIMGTASYMSPEQARGKQVDKRTDVWAFGVVLYEALTGRPAFAREDVSDTIAAVLRDELDLDTLSPGTPPAIRKLLRRCLERDPRQRLRDVGDARLEMEEDLSPLPEPPDTAKAAVARSLGGRRSWLPAAVASLLTAFVVWSLTRPSPTPRPVTRFVIAAPPGVRITEVTVAPDGRTVAFSGTREGQSQIYLRALDQLEALPVSGSEGGRAPFFSPDGEWIGFVSGSSAAGDSEVKRVSRAGGAPITICEGDYIGADWWPDDTILLGSRKGVQRVPASGGVPTPLTSVAEGESHFGPQFLHGNRAVLFYVWTGSLDSAHIEVFSLDTGERRRLIDGTSPQLAPRRLVFSRAGSLWAVPFDVGRLALDGDPVRVVEHVEVSPSGLAPYALASDGSLGFAPAGAAFQQVLLWVDREGQETRIDAPAGEYSYPRISPDGRRIAFGSGDDIWLYDLDRSMQTRFTFDAEQDGDPTWTPDGQRLLFHSHRDGRGDIYSQPADGTGEVQRLTTGIGEQVPIQTTPDGRALIFWKSEPDTGYDLYRLALDGSGPPEKLVATPANEAAGMVSPDGRWLAYASDESGILEVYVRPFPDVDQGKWQVSSGGGQAPLWNPDGRELVYRRGAQVRRVSVETTSGFVAGIPETLFEGPYVHGRVDEPFYDITPDGQRFLMLKDDVASSSVVSSQMIFILNWHQELLRLVPVK